MVNLGLVSGKEALKMVSLSFRLPYFTHWGQSIVVSGSESVLGSWNVKQGLLLSPFHQGEELIWGGTISVPFGFQCEYSYYLVDDNRKVLRWEKGKKRKVILSEGIQDGDVIELHDLWQSSLHPINREDEISTAGSLSEVEEKTIKAVSEQTKTQEQVRKLREDLVVKEQCEEELGRILEEMLPEPTSVEPQRSRPRRKNSVDECDISTFDSSDFSLPEDQDQPVTLSAAPPTVGGNKYLPSTCSSASDNFCINGQANLNKETDNQVQSMLSLEPLDLTASSSSKYPMKQDQESQDSSRDAAQPIRNLLQVSLAHELASESVGLHASCIKKEIRKDAGNKQDSKSTTVIRSMSYYDAEDQYESSQVLNERLLFDKVIFKSRIETGGLHLCCGNGVTF